MKLIRQDYDKKLDFISESNVLTDSNFSKILECLTYNKIVYYFGNDNNIYPRFRVIYDT